MPLTVILNGQPRIFQSLASQATLGDLVQDLGLKGDRVAIEHNGEIAPRTIWNEVRLEENDRLEIVHFVGGGSL
jgi:sulfur carrier protein